MQNIQPYTESDCQRLGIPFNHTTSKSDVPAGPILSGAGILQASLKEPPMSASQCMRAGVPLPPETTEISTLTIDENTGHLVRSIIEIPTI